MENRKRIIFDDSVEGNDYVVVYHTGYAETDDSFENDETTEIVLTAPDFDTAVRYAQQYLRKMQTDDATADDWAGAQILSVELH